MKTYAMGIDIGSLTAKGVLFCENKIIATHLQKACPGAEKSIISVLESLCANANLKTSEINAICTTGYGRFQCPFPSLEKSEISCHGLGAFWANPQVRSIIDIGGQDSKIIMVNDQGQVQEFAMNDKCAAGTGRTLELLAQTMNISIDELARLSHLGKGKLQISNRCSIFMENDIAEAMQCSINKQEIAYSIVHAVASRVLQLATSMKMSDSIVITGGVSKNSGVVTALQGQLGKKFATLNTDPQLIGAVGAALFAQKSLSLKAAERPKEGTQ